RARNSGKVGDITEIKIAVIAEKLGILLAEVAYENRKTSGMQIVAEHHPHVGEGITVLVQRNSGLEAYIGKVAVTIVAIQVIPSTVVCDEEVEFSVPIEIRPDGCKSKSSL